MHFALFPGCSLHYHIDFLGVENIREKTIIESKSKNKILLLNIDGVITDRTGDVLSREPGMVSRVKQRLDLARRDKNIRGIILRINTPGGDPADSETIRNEIERYKKETGQPVLAYFMNLAASGGYYIAMAADRVMAHPMNICGSIGVIAVYPQVRGLLDKIGVKMDVIKTGAFKDSGSPFRDMREEERKNFQNIADSMYERFIKVVAENRKGALAEEEVKKLADGRVFTADQALENRLVDSKGFMEEALSEARKMAGLVDSRLVVYTFFPDQAHNFYSTGEMAVSDGSFINGYLKNILTPGVYFLWMPEKSQ